jgi:hypothetical protein
MSTNTPPTQQPPPYGPGSYMSILRVRGHKPPPRKRNRVFLWVFLAIQVIFLGWTIYAGVSAPQSGYSPGVAIQVGLWVLTDVILGAIYAIWQLPRSPR